MTKTREITRLDIMAYLDLASNPGSKPQRFSDLCEIMRHSPVTFNGKQEGCIKALKILLGWI